VELTAGRWELCVIQKLRSPLILFVKCAFGLVCLLWSYVEMHRDLCLSIFFDFVEFVVPLANELVGGVLVCAIAWDSVYGFKGQSAVLLPITSVPNYKLCGSLYRLLFGRLIPLLVGSEDAICLFIWI